MYVPTLRRSPPGERPAPASQPDVWTRRHTVWLAGALILIGAFYGLTLRDGHASSDFFRLFEHALNLAEGRPYASTLMIVAPGATLMTYPPGLPVILLGLYALFGIDLAVMKGLVIVSFLGSLAVLAALFRRALPPAYVFLAVAFAGLQPWFWEMKDQILAGMPFLFLASLTLLLARRLERTPAGGRAWWGWAAAVGCAVFAATMMRSVGLVLVPSLLLYDLLARRRWWPSMAFWAPAAVFAALFVVQRAVLGGGDDSVYHALLLGELADPLRALRRMAGRVYAYAHGSTVNVLFANGYVPALRYLTAGALFGPAAFGFVDHVRRRLSLTDAFAVCYLGLIVVYPFQIARYLIPVHVLFFFYAAYGLSLLRERLPTPGAGRALVVGVAALVFGGYLLNYTTRDFERIPNNVASADALEMYAYITRYTPEDAVIVYREPHTMGVYARRRSTLPGTPEERALRFAPDYMPVVFRHLAVTDADFVVTGPLGSGFSEYDLLPTVNLVRDYPTLFELEFANDELELYRILQHRLPPANSVRAR